MYRFACLILALVAACYGAAIPEERIVGGTPASTNQFPWQVSLQNNNNHFCGGSIVTNRWILTAAHCLTSAISSMTVVTATLVLNRGGDRYRVSRTVLHPHYNSWTLANDIAVVQTTSNIVMRPNAQIVRLPTMHFGNVNAPAVVSGWGRTSFPGNLSNQLLFLNTIIVSQAQCAASSWRVTPNNICALTRAGQGACHGDSGGPLTANNVQIGVVSFGDPCARGTPDAYIRVFSYLNWFRPIIGR